MAKTDGPVVNPDRFRIGPRRAVSAILPDSRLEECIEELRAAGFAGDAVEVLSGEEGRDVLDIAGRHHGFRGWLIRQIQVTGSIHNEMLNYDSALKKGLVAVVVTISTSADTRHAAAILADHGGDRIISYGTKGSDTEWL